MDITIRFAGCAGCLDDGNCEDQNKALDIMNEAVVKIVGETAVLVNPIELIPNDAS